MKKESLFHDTITYTSNLKTVLKKCPYDSKYDITVPNYIILLDDGTYGVFKFNKSNDTLRERGINGISSITDCYKSIWDCRTLKEAKIAVYEDHIGLHEPIFVLNQAE